MTYPILMYGGQAGILSAYNCNYEYFFIIGGDGLIKWRGSWDALAITAAANDAVAELSTTPVPEVPTDSHRLLANYPNPFNPMTRIPYELGGGGGTVAVQLDVLDVRGRLIKTLVRAEQTAGLRYEALWDGTDTHGRQVPSGIYLSQLRTGGAAQSRCLTLVK